MNRRIVLDAIKFSFESKFENNFNRFSSKRDDVMRRNADEIPHTLCDKPSYFHPISRHTYITVCTQFVHRHKRMETYSLYCYLHHPRNSTSIYIYLLSNEIILCITL